MNSVVLSGRPTKDPTANYTPAGLAVTRFTLAVDRGKDKGADFISCVAFDKTAETIAQYCRKGGKILVTGRIQTGSFDGKNGKVYTTDVIVNTFEFCEPKPAERDDGFISIADGDDVPFA